MIRLLRHGGLIGLSVVLALAAGTTLNGAAPVGPLVKVGEFKMREPRYGAGAVAKGDYLYLVAGGNRGTFALDSVERMDLRTGVSEPFARLRVGRLHPGVVLVDDRIYVLGGSRPVAFHGELEDSVEVIDLATGAVTDGPKMPRGRDHFACVALAGKIHVMGGRWQRGQKVVETNTTCAFDLAANRWTDGPPMPTPRQCAGAAVDGGFIVVAGGFNGQRALTQVEVLNPRENVWRTLPPLCRSASGHSVVFGGHELFLLGDYEELGSLLVYDLRSKESKRFKVDEAVGRFSAAVGHLDKIYVAGGISSAPIEAFNSVVVLAPAGEPR